MENENENLNSSNESKDAIVIDENDDIDAVKEKFGKLSEKGKKTSDDNKKLFSRAKRAEGFEQDGEGNWVKAEKKEPKETKTVKKEPEAKSDEEFGLLELTFLKGEDIKSEDEIEFVKKELKEAGLSNDKLPKLFANKYFQSSLKEFKTEKTNTKATSDVKGGGGESNAKNKAEFYIARGTPASKEDIPDNKVRRKVNVAFVAAQKGGGKTFYND